MYKTPKTVKNKVFTNWSKNLTTASQKAIKVRKTHTGTPLMINASDKVKRGVKLVDTVNLADPTSDRTKVKRKIKTIKQKFKALRDKGIEKRMIKDPIKIEKTEGNNFHQSMRKINRMIKSLSVIRYVADYGYPFVTKYKKKERDYLKDKEKAKLVKKSRKSAGKLNLKGAHLDFFNEVMEEKPFYRCLEDKLQRTRSIQHREAISKARKLRRN